MAIFVNQSLLTLNLDCNIDISAASEVLILYRKPSGVEGQWVGAANVNLATYDVQDGDLDEVGVWKIQPKVTIAGEVGYGEIKPMTVSSPIS